MKDKKVRVKITPDGSGGVRVLKFNDVKDIRWEQDRKVVPLYNGAGDQIGYRVGPTTFTLTLTNGTTKAEFF